MKDIGNKSLGLHEDLLKQQYDPMMRNIEANNLLNLASSDIDLALQLNKGLKYFDEKTLISEWDFHNRFPFFFERQLDEFITNELSRFARGSIKNKEIIVRLSPYTLNHFIDKMLSYEELKTSAIQGVGLRYKRYWLYLLQSQDMYDKQFNFYI